MTTPNRKYSLPPNPQPPEIQREADPGQIEDRTPVRRDVDERPREERRGDESELHRPGARHRRSDDPEIEVNPREDERQPEEHPIEPVQIVPASEFHLSVTRASGVYRSESVKGCLRKA